MSDFHSRLSPEAIEEMLSTLRHLAHVHGRGFTLGDAEMKHVTEAVALADADIERTRWRPVSERAAIPLAAE